MGFARSAFTCLMSSITSERPENFYSSVPTRQKNGVLRKSSFSQSVPLCLVNMLTWLQAISTGQRGGAATETTSVPLRKPLRTALCQRRRGLHRCGDLDRSQTTGLTFVGSFNLLNQIGIGKYDFTALSPSH